MNEASEPKSSNEVDLLLRNAQLRDELEPFVDDSITQLDMHNVPTRVENEYLECMLAWERAPVLPICQWFTPTLVLPPPESLEDDALHHLLWETVHRLFQKRIVLEFTDHLSDRQLYCLIYRDILPAHEKKIDPAHNYLHWNCADVGDEPDVWLRYYAGDEERQGWRESGGGPLPPHERPPFPRDLPQPPG
jgi:hypothetical protein